jgi:hypothetical protein
MWRCDDVEMWRCDDVVMLNFNISTSSHLHFLHRYISYIATSPHRHIATSPHLHISTSKDV